jgi:hypothetical protein
MLRHARRTSKEGRKKESRGLSGLRRERSRYICCIYEVEGERLDPSVAQNEEKKGNRRVH